MRYRDDREALRQRADELQHELEQAERRLREAEEAVERHARKDELDEQQLRSLREQVAALKERLGEQDAPEAKRAKGGDSNDGYATGVRVAVGLSVMILGTSALVMSKIRSDHSEPVRVVDPLPVEDAPVEDAPKVAPSQAAASSAVVESVLFGAEVIRQDNARVAVGSGCILQVEAARGLKVKALSLRCGARTLYDARDALGTASPKRETDLREVSGPHPDSARYWLRYVDIGERTGPRSQIDLNTHHHRIHVFKQGPDPWSALLHVRDVSFARRGAALGSRLPSATSFSAGVYARAQLDKREGTLPPELTEKGLSCDLSVRATGDSFNCRFMLRCGAYIVYGADGAGYGKCRIEEGWPVSAEDDAKTHDDNDPSMRYDWKQRTLEVSDGQYDRTWSATFKLSEPPGCGWDQVLGGYGYPSKGPRLDVSFQAVDGQLKLKWPQSEDAEQNALIDVVPAPQDCSLAALDIRTKKRQYFIERGPGSKTLGGYWHAPDDKRGGTFALSRP